MTFKDKNIVVVGLARSGTGAANLLSELGAHVTITDSKPASALRENINRLVSSIKVITSGNPPEIFESADMIVISPGVPPDIPALERARIKGVPLIGELELAYRVIEGQRIEGRGQLEFIGITGTNGKSTTTTLVDLMLKEGGFNTILGGNIGIALTEEILKTGIRDWGLGDSKGKDPSPVTRYPLPDYIVTEISSFQLETIKEFRPKIAAILNITPDHLDRYHSAEEYIDAKARIFENQTSEDFLILNADDQELMRVESEKLKVKSEKPRVIYFSRKKEVEGIYMRDGVLFLNLSLVTRHSSLITADEIRIKGVHNVENAMAASLIALVAGCSLDAVRNVLRNFPGLEHRLEFVAEINGVKFINDSKGTNVGAVEKSLESFDNLVLIMGGLDKGSDFSILKDSVRQRVNSLILIGKAKDKIAEALGGVTETLFAKDLNEAVELSYAKASSGDTVMLSPGCASFDMFRDFEDRGRQFKKVVEELRVRSEE